MTHKIEIYNDSKAFVELVDHMGSDLTIVNSARVSFGKSKTLLDEKDVKLIKYLVKNKHTSTFEHNTVTFRIKVPLFVRSQHHRHRTWSYNEISRRYTDFDIEFYQPDSFRTQHKTNRQASNASSLINPVVGFMKVPNGASSTAHQLVRLHHERSLALYNSLLSAGICREQARGVLPQNMYTEYYGTCNLSNLLKFIQLRTHSGAQWEIQQLAKAMLKLAQELWPVAVSAYVDLQERNKK